MRPWTTNWRRLPGVVWGFSQPIADNMEEAVSGVKGQLATKVYGDDLHVLEDKAEEVVNVMRKVKGIEDLGVFRVLGQPNDNFIVDRQAASRYQINVADVQDAIATAAGGNALTQVLQGEQRYDLVMRYLPQFRNTKEAIANIRLLAPSGERVSLAQLCKVEERDGGSEIYREGNQRYVAIKYSVRGRDLGGAVGEAIKKLPRKSSCRAAITSTGRASTRAKSAPKRGCDHRAVDRAADPDHSLHHVPLIQMGAADSGQRDAGAHRRPGGAAGHAHQFQRVFGRRHARALRRFRANRRHHAGIHQSIACARSHVEDSAVEGAVLRLRPIMMTMLVATLGLLPAAMSHGIGSDSQRPFAIVIVGGLLSDLVMSIFLLPTLYVWMAGRNDVLPVPEAEFDEAV